MKHRKDYPPFLKVKEAAQLLRCSGATIYKAIEKDTIPYIEFADGTKRIDRDELFRRARRGNQILKEVD